MFEIVKDLNSRENISFLLAEQNTMVALKYADFGYILEKRPGGDGRDAEGLRTNEDVKEFYLGLSLGRAQILQGRQTLPPPQTLAFVTAVRRSWRRCRQACWQSQRRPRLALSGYFAIPGAIREGPRSTGKIGEI